MKFKSKSIPGECVGQTGFGPTAVVPNQALTLEEIISRFTRGEALPIGREASYHESDDDLEKIAHMDLVDRAEYVDKLKSTQDQFEKQETKKAQAERKRLEKIALDKIEAEKKAEQAGNAK